MLMGKRQRPPMKIPTSMTEFTLDLNYTATIDGCLRNSRPPLDHPKNPFNIINPLRSTDGTVDPRLVSPTIASKIHRRNSADYTQSLCWGHVLPGSDGLLAKAEKWYQRIFVFRSLCWRHVLPGRIKGDESPSLARITREEFVWVPSSD
ncbi:hypothetical protein L1887_08753 [Cichorium endivia]|nr:hypothetical protein L1887_08753 [Cichorium endivia]